MLQRFVLILGIVLAVVGVDAPAHAATWAVLDTSVAHAGMRQSDGTLRYFTADEASHLDWQWRSAPDSIKQSLLDSTKVDWVREGWSPTRGDCLVRFNTYFPSLLGYITSHGDTDVVAFPGYNPLLESDDSDMTYSHIVNGMSRYGYSETGGSRPVMWIGACALLSAGEDSDYWSALHQKGFASVAGFTSNVPTLDEPRLARYFFYTDTRATPRRSVYATYESTWAWMESHLYDGTFKHPWLVYDSGFTVVGYPGSAYMNY